MFFIREVILSAKYSFALSFILGLICFASPVYSQKKAAAGNSKIDKKGQPLSNSKVKDLKTSKSEKKSDKNSQAKTAQTIVKDKFADKKSKPDKSKSDKTRNEKLSKAELAKQADKKRKDDLKRDEEGRKREDANLAKLKKEKALKEELAREAERKRKESRKREEEERKREDARLARLKQEKLRKLEIARKAEQKRREELKRQQMEELQKEDASEDEQATVTRKTVVITDTLPKPATSTNTSEPRKPVVVTDSIQAGNVKEEVIKESAVRKRSFEKGLRAETIENIANDDITGEDLEVRRAAINALGDRAGTVVVMEPQTGKVLTIVNQEWGIRKAFKPCSTIKLVTGIAGLNERVINQQGDVQSRRMRIGLDDALAHSNNSYFQSVGSTVGNEKMIQYARSMGLGEPTGINAQGETAGRLPYGNNNVRIYSHGDDFEVTPLQLAVMVSAISNGGKIVVPRIPKEKYEKTRFQGYTRGDVKIPQANLQRVLPGMLGAVNYGTAQRAYDDSLNIAGKTGSCIGEGSWLGLFASVAPVVDPKLSVVVITRGQGERGKFASGVAGKIYKALGNRIFSNGRDFTAKAPLILKPQQKVTAKNSALLDNDEGEETGEGDSNRSLQRTQPAKPAARKGEEVKTSGEPSNLFDPVVIEINRGQKRPRIVTPNQ